MKKIVGIFTGVMTFAAAVNVFAGTDYKGYSTTVGAFNGSGYTGYDHVKSSDGANGSVKSTSVGGSYEVDVRMLDAQGNGGDWARNLGDSETLTLDGHINHKKGDDMRLQFSNDIDTSVSVQVSGSWRSDNN